MKMKLKYLFFGVALIGLTSFSSDNLDTKYIKATQKSDEWMAFLWTEYADNWRYYEEETTEQLIKPVAQLNVQDASASAAK